MKRQLQLHGSNDCQAGGHTPLRRRPGDVDLRNVRPFDSGAIRSSLGGEGKKRMQPPRSPRSEWQEPSDAELLEVLLGQDAVDAEILKRTDAPDELEKALRLLWSACRSAGPGG